MAEQQSNQYEFIPNSKKQDSMLNEHLKADDILNQLDRLLAGYEYNQDKEKWERKEITVEINGKYLLVAEEPVVSDSERNSMMGLLRMHLNSNTFLTTLDKSEINAIMWDINLVLMEIFYRLRNKISRINQKILWTILDDTIYLGLKRSDGKITLDAVSKSMHSIEHKTLGEQEKKEFKMFG